MIRLWWAYSTIGHIDFNDKDVCKYVLICISCSMNLYPGARGAYSEAVGPALPVHMLVGGAERAAVNLPGQFIRVWDSH